jgi:hypothetical protein
MIADLMSLTLLSSEDLWMFENSAPEDKKCGSYSTGLQYIKEWGCVSTRWTIVEGEGDDFFVYMRPCTTYHFARDSRESAISVKKETRSWEPYRY